MAELDVTRDEVVLEQTGFRLSWGAIFAGFIVAAMIQVLLSLLGVAVGFTTWDVGDPARDLGMGLGIFMALSALIALFVGGITTGRLAGVLTKGDGALHGVVMWGIATLVNLWLLTTGAGFFLGGAFDVLGRTVATTTEVVAGGMLEAGRAAVGQAGPVDTGQIQREIEASLEATGRPALSPEALEAGMDTIRQRTTAPGTSPAELAREIQQMIEARAGQVDREAIMNVVVSRTGMERAEAERLATRIETVARQARTEIAGVADTLGARAEEAGSAATDYLATAAWWTLLALALGAGAAAWGASLTAKA